VILHIRGSTIQTVYDERLDLRALGLVSINRASMVEPDCQGRWWAEMVPHVTGHPSERLGPFERRSQALAAELAWLEENL